MGGILQMLLLAMLILLPNVAVQAQDQVFIVHRRLDVAPNYQQLCNIGLPSCLHRRDRAHGGLYLFSSSQQRSHLLLPTANCLEETARCELEDLALRKSFTPFANSVAAVSPSGNLVAVVGLFMHRAGGVGEVVIDTAEYQIIVVDLNSGERFHVFNTSEIDGDASQHLPVELEINEALPAPLIGQIERAVKEQGHEDFDWGHQASFVLRFASETRLQFRVFTEVDRPIAVRGDLGANRSFEIDLSRMRLNDAPIDEGDDEIVLCGLHRSWLADSDYLLPKSDEAANERQTLSWSSNGAWLAYNRVYWGEGNGWGERWFRHQLFLQSLDKVQPKMGQVDERLDVFKSRHDALHIEQLHRHYLPTIRWIGDERALYTLGREVGLIDLRRLKSDALGALAPNQPMFVTDDATLKMHDAAIDEPSLPPHVGHWPTKQQRFGVLLRNNLVLEATADAKHLVVVGESEASRQWPMRRSRFEAPYLSERVEADQHWGFATLYAYGEAKAVRFALYPSSLWQVVQLGKRWWQDLHWRKEAGTMSSYHGKVDYWLNASLRQPYLEGDYLYFTLKRDLQGLALRSARERALIHPVVDQMDGATLCRIPLSVGDEAAIEYLTASGFKRLAAMGTPNNQPMDGVVFYAPRPISRPTVQPISLAKDTAK